MTEAIYHADAYVTGFEATVLDVADEGILLDRTAFYPGGGGQPADAGLVAWNGGVATLTEVRRGTDGPRHLLDGDAPAPMPGMQVHGTVDWPRRHALMRAHTALHILCGVVWRDFRAQVTGGSMDVGQARMDFELERMSAEVAEEIERRVNDEIVAARPIRVRVLPRDEAFAIPDLIRTKVNLLPAGIEHVRVVEIVGLDLQADGGTHVANTRHVGHVSVVGHESKGRINKRLRVRVDDFPR